MTTTTPAAPSPLRRDPNLYVVFAVTLMAILGVTSVTPAFPTIARELGITAREVGWLISVFTLPGIVLTPVIGVLADRVGRKAFLVPSLFLFGIAGAACGLARSFELLLVLRFFQGIGAAALGALNLTIVGDLYAGFRRAAVMGYNSSVLAVGTGVYPAVGGLLATVAWYAPFFLALLAIPVGLLVLLVLRNPEPAVEHSFGEYLRQAGRTIARGRVLVLFLASVVTFILIYGPFLTYFPFVLERGFGASALWIGIAMSATSAATALTALQLGRLTLRFGERRLVHAGFVLYVASMVTLPLATSVWQLAFPVLVLGIANGINIPSIMTRLAAAAPAHLRAVIMSTNGMLLRVGQTTGPVLVGIAVDRWDLNAGYYACGVLALGMVGVLLVADRG